MKMSKYIVGGVWDLVESVPDRCSLHRSEYLISSGKISIPMFSRLMAVNH